MQVPCSGQLRSGWKAGSSPDQLLYCGRKLFHAADKHGHSPEIVIFDSFAPCGHATPADAVLDGKENAPFRIIKRMDDQLRSRRIKRTTEGGGLFVHAAVAASAVHNVKTHALNQMGVGGWHGAVDARRLVLHGSVQRGS